MNKINTKNQESKKTFIIGAGFNCFLKKHINGKFVSPPVSKNFFKYCLERENQYTVNGIIEKVLHYIEKNFNRSKNDLLNSDFDLELFLTFIEAQLSDAKSKKDKDEINYLEEIRLNVMVAIGEVFFDLEWKPPQGYELLEKFGKMIYETKSDVITFNYDCLVEWGIEHSSKGRSGNYVKNRRDGAPYFNWDRYSAYGIRFTKIRRTGRMSYYDANHGENIAKKFYENHYNPSPDFRFIKLHGSNNWFRYSKLSRNKKEIDKLPFEKGFDHLAREGKLYIKSDKLPDSLKNELLCFNGDWQFGVMPTWKKLRYRNVLEPIIIPPILEKDKEIKNKIFQQLWSDAKEILLKTNEIVFIGYSFPDTDFYSKKLFIEVFSKNKNIDVTFVNPDSRVVNKFREMVNFKKEIKLYNDSGSYIKIFDHE